MGAGPTLLIALVLVLGTCFSMMVMDDIKTAILLLIAAAALLTNLRFEQNQEKKEVSQEWHDFTVSNSCGIFEKNEKAGTISWKCADGIIYTKPASILNGAK